MTQSQIQSVAQSNVPYIKTCFGLTYLFVESGKTWMTYRNEENYKVTELATENKINAYING